MLSKKKKNYNGTYDTNEILCEILPNAIYT